jgi:hypothetical protein
MSGSCLGCGAVMLVIAAITPGALTAGPVRCPEALCHALVVNGSRLSAITRPPPAPTGR